MGSKGSEFLGQSAPRITAGNITVLAMEELNSKSFGSSME